MASSSLGQTYLEAREKRLSTEAQEELEDQLASGASTPAFDPAAGTAAQTPSQAGPERKISCLECRSSKVKCSGQNSFDGICTRCKRIQRPCVFEAHRRGRKPDSMKFKKLEKSFESIEKALQDLRRMQTGEEDNAVDTQDSRSSEAGTSSATRIREPEPIRPMKSTARFSTSQQGLLQGKIEGDIEETRKFLSIEPQPSLHPHRISPERVPSPHSSISNHNSPPTSGLRDPEEPNNLGLPPLSNPLKLLAQASVSESAREAEMTTEEERVPRDLNGSRSSQTQRPQQGAGSRAYFELGIYSSRLDIDLDPANPRFDPVSKGFISEAESRDLFNLYMDLLNRSITLLEPVLHTYEYVRNHSALLLTAICALSARFSYRSKAAEISVRLDSHVKETLLPAVLLEGYKSVEIAQGLIVLAAYHPATETLAEDRAWSLVGYAIRIAAELDMNSRLVSPHAQGDEMLQRRLRNRERTQMNLWLYEQSISNHMGRRSSLGVDPVILGSVNWHLSKWAVPHDTAIVAMIQLRRLLLRNFEHFDSIDLQSQSTNKNFQLDFFRRSCKADLEDWRMQWCPQDSSSTFRLNNAPLYLNYSNVLLNSLPLRNAHLLDHQALEPIYRESYRASVQYISAFLDKLVPDKVAFAHNSTIVTVVYVCVFALKLTSMDLNLYPYIDAEYIIELVVKIANALKAAGNITPHRNGTATSYAPYLAAILSRVSKTRRKSRASKTHTHSLLNQPSDTAADLGGFSPQEHTPSHRKLNETLAHSFSGSEDSSSSISLSGNFQFQAGPSGVQSAPTPGPSQYAAFGEDEALERLLGESLFSDLPDLNFAWPEIAQR